MNIQADSSESGWHTFVFITSGLVWIGRAVLELVFQPDYWNPRTMVDYMAVFGTSLSLILLAVSIWLIQRESQLLGRWRIWLWRVGIGLACGGALLAGIANFGEDWIAIKSLSTFFVIGSLTMFAGLLLAGIGAIRAVGVSRWTGWLLIACAIGWGRIEERGGFIVGIALILLAIEQVRLGQSGRSTQSI